MVIVMIIFWIYKISWLWSKYFYPIDRFRSSFKHNSIISVISILIAALWTINDHNYWIEKIGIECNIKSVFLAFNI